MATGGSAMKKEFNLQLILFFTVLTSVLTAAVIVTWEQGLRPPFYNWVERNYPGHENAERRWKIQQRSEHFFISMTVDVVVVSILVALCGRQQRRIAESEQRYRALFEHANDGIGMIHPSDFRLVEANSKFGEILGCDPRGLEGRDVRELMHPCASCEDNGQSPETIARLLAGSEAGVTELMLGTAAGEARLVAVSYNTISSRNERLIVLLIRDLSVRKRLEAERQEMQRQLYEAAKLASLGELSAGVAHEINNPLNGVINYAQLLKDEGVERTEFERQMIDGIIGEGRRIAQIVRGLLTFARRDESKLKQVCLAETINSSFAVFGRQFEKDGVRVEIDIDPDLPPVCANASRLRQVVVNMISNAHDALKAKRSTNGDEKVFRITAQYMENAASEGKAKARIDFYDNGVGIRQDDIPKIFDPFFTTRRDSGGTGLGLSISFGIVSDHGGTITVESEEGRYTRFRVELPAIKQWEPEYV